MRIELPLPNRKDIRDLLRVYKKVYNSEILFMKELLESGDIDRCIDYAKSRYGWRHQKYIGIQKNIPTYKTMIVDSAIRASMYQFRQIASGKLSKNDLVELSSNFDIKLRGDVCIRIKGDKHRTLIIGRLKKISLPPGCDPIKLKKDIARRTKAVIHVERDSIKLIVESPDE